jgi:hypothetical protein
MRQHQILDRPAGKALLRLLDGPFRVVIVGRRVEHHEIGRYRHDQTVVRAVPDLKDGGRDLVDMYHRAFGLSRTR